MVELNTQNMRVQEQGLNTEEQLSPQQKALAQAQAGLQANTSLNGATKQVLSSLIGAYAEMGVNLSQYKDLSFETLSQIQQSNHESIMEMLEDWSKFLQKQAELDKKAASKALETSKEIQHYLLNQNDAPIVNAKGELISDKRVIRRMTPKQRAIHACAMHNQSNIKKLTTTVSTTKVATAAPVRSSLNASTVERPTGYKPSTVHLQDALPQPAKDIGVATLVTGNQIN